MKPISKQLQRRISYSVSLIKKAEKPALTYDDKGFHVAFSGGKDSQVIYELYKMAGVKFEAHMQLTSVDPPQVLKFIRKQYPLVHLHPPKENMFKLIVRKKCLPLRQIRFCCQELKEHAGVGTVTVLGIRAQESAKRAKRREFEINKKEITLDQFNIDREQIIDCVKGNDKVLLSPILSWTHADVWEFIRAFELPYCELYDIGYTRIGCIFCPMASKKSKQIDRKLFPNVEKAYKKAIEKLASQNGYCDRLDCNTDDIFNWWISNQSIEKWKANKKQLQLNFDE